MVGAPYARRRDAKATTEHVQPSAGAAPDRRGPHWASLELPVLLRAHRPRPRCASPAAQFARDTEVHELWPVGALHCRSELTLPSADAGPSASPLTQQRPVRISGRGVCHEPWSCGNRKLTPPRRPYQLTVPCLVVSTSSPCPALNRNASMLRVRNVRAWGSITFRP